MTPRPAGPPPWRVVLVATLASLLSWILAFPSLNQGWPMLFLILAPAGTFLGYWYGRMPGRGLLAWILIMLAGVVGFRVGQAVPGTSFMFADLFAAVMYAGLFAIGTTLLALVMLPIALYRRPRSRPSADRATGVTHTNFSR